MLSEKVDSMSKTALLCVCVVCVWMCDVWCACILCVCGVWRVYVQRSPEGPRHLHRIPRLSEAPWEVP